MRRTTSVCIALGPHCAQLHCLMPYLYIGATNVIMHKADPAEMIRLIEKYQITHMFAPPPSGSAF